MARTLQQLKESVERLIEQQGADAPVAAFIFTNEDVFTWENDGGDQVPVDRNIAEKVLNEVEDIDYIYSQVFDMIDEQLSSLGITND